VYVTGTVHSAKIWKNDPVARNHWRQRHISKNKRSIAGRKALCHNKQTVSASRLPSEDHRARPSFDAMTLGAVGRKSSGNVITVLSASRPLPDGRRRGTHESVNVEIRRSV
jgi:hypothetical protein